jgi:hypothetical protein
MLRPDFCLNFVTCFLAQIADGCMQTPFANFSLTLIDSKKKQYLILSGYIVIIHEATLLYRALLLGTDQRKFLLLMGLILPLILFLLNRWRSKKNPPSYADLTPFYVYPSFAWIYCEHYKTAALLLTLFLLYKISMRPLVVRFCEQGINYPTFPKKLIAWQSIEQVMVKDDLLTIDLRSNKLMQHAIEKNSFIDAREVSEFNAYCQQKTKRV